MKKQNQPTVVRLSRKFDKQLLILLSEELNTLKAAKNKIIKKLNPVSDDGLLVA